MIGWHSCDHTAPVFEDDVLSVSATLDDAHPNALAHRLIAERTLPFLAGDAGR